MLAQKLLGATGVAPFPQLTSITTTASQSISTISVNLPTGIQAGEGLIIFVTIWDSGSSMSFSTPAGWTLVTTAKLVTSNPYAPRAAVYVKVATGSEGPTQTISLSSAGPGTAIAARILNWNSSLVAGTSVGANIISPNPASLTAPWGASKNLWIAFVGHRGSTSITAWPTNYSLYQTAALNPNTSDRGETYIIARELENATEDPGPFTFATARELVVGTVVLGGQ